MTRRDLPGALRDFDRFIELLPQHPGGYLNRGLVWLARKKYSRALADFNRALELRPGWPMALVNRGTVYQNQKRWKEALADFEQVVDLRPGHGEAHFWRGKSLVKLGRRGLAKKAFSQAIHHNPRWGEAYFQRGNLRLHLDRDLEGALADFERAVKWKPRLVPALANRASALIQLKKWNRAVAAINQLLQVKPDLYIYYKLRAYVWMKRGRYGRARQDLRYFLSRFPNDREGRRLWRELQGKR